MCSRLNVEAAEEMAETFVDLADADTERTIEMKEEVISRTEMRRTTNEPGLDAYDNHDFTRGGSGRTLGIGSDEGGRPKRPVLTHQPSSRFMSPEAEAELPPNPQADGSYSHPSSSFVFPEDLIFFVVAIRARMFRVHLDDGVKTIMYNEEANLAEELKKIDQKRVKKKTNLQF